MYPNFSLYFYRPNINPFYIMVRFFIFNIHIGLEHGNFTSLPVPTYKKPCGVFNFQTQWCYFNQVALRSFRVNSLSICTFALLRLSNKPNFNNRLDETKLFRKSLLTILSIPLNINSLVMDISFERHYYCAIYSA